MSPLICLFANTFDYPQGGGHFWAHLNWALGFRDAGCKVIWHERIAVNKENSPEKIVVRINTLKGILSSYGLKNCLSASSYAGEALPAEISQYCLGIEAAAESDLLFSLCYEENACVVRHFRRTALLDIDPGQLQTFMKLGMINLTPHDFYFTIGETVGQPGSLVPDVGIQWHYTPPSVSVDCWPVSKTSVGAAPFTTVSHWYDGQWMPDGNGGHYNNEKRTAFVPYLALPSRVESPLELAICIEKDRQERNLLESKGWCVKEAWEVSSTPQDYQNYIQNSRGEFSCVKAHYVRMQTAWVSDRSLCYLASGKPVIIEHNGPSRILPDAGGMFRFRNFDEAVRCFETVESDYEHQCVLARELAEKHFDARTNAKRILEIALP